MHVMMTSVAKLSRRSARAPGGEFYEAERRRGEE
jgi:hypothetical protein